MSGRGRGRGRGRGGPSTQSISQQFLLRSAQEAGFDVRNLRALNGDKVGGIFPDIELDSTGGLRRGPIGKAQQDGSGGANVKQEDGGSKPSDSTKKINEPQRSPQTIYLISKSREFQHRFQSSVFYVRSNKESVPDVVRYSDRFRPPPTTDSSAVLSHCLGGRKRTRCGVFVPEELVGGQRRMRGAGDSGAHGAEGKEKAKGLNLEELAAKIRKEGVGENEDENQDEDEYFEDEGEESDGADYVTNYYESEGEESKGSDGEPTF